jgi:hypothetical protein
MDRACENCLGTPEDLPRGCVCELSDEPGTYLGMVDGFRHFAMMAADFIDAIDKTAQFKQYCDNLSLGRRRGAP